MGEKMLDVRDLVVNYGAIRALKGISFNVQKGEIISLIGSNGAGKTTTLHSISNLIKKQSGSVIFNNEDVTNLSPEQIVRRGLIHVPEGRRVFANLSVKDNLMMGAYTRKDKAEIKKDLEHVFELFPRMKERIHQLSGTLSGGEQQMLAMGRGLMAKPDLMLLDGPSMGLDPILVDEIFDIIQKINKEGTTILLVEQNAFKAMSIANRVYILETGNVILSGNSADVINDPAVKTAYLGG